MLALQERGAVTFDYGNNLRGQALAAGEAGAFDIGGFVPLFIRPLFCEGKGPFRWAALSGDPEDIAVDRRGHPRAFPEDAALRRWIRLARERVAFQGLPARICWLGYGERAKAGRVFNELVAAGKVKAPIVIGRDHLDCGSVASPNRETEGMHDGSDAIARLADPQRPAQRGQRRHLGLRPPRRRRGHRLLAPRRHGHRRRRHARPPPAAWSACSPATPGWAWCATPTPATRRRSTAPASGASTCRCSTGRSAGRPERRTADWVSVPADRERIPGDGEGVPADRDGVPGDRDGVPGDRDGVPGDRDGVPGDRKVFRVTGKVFQATGKVFPATGTVFPVTGTVLPVNQTVFP